LRKQEGKKEEKQKQMKKKGKKKERKREEREGRKECQVPESNFFSFSLFFFLEKK